ncbi:MAG: sulfate reduction electron transfer complex DsrMKJOP subunit DsrJ [Candidatus Magnetominusculus sp. LBB02]|nr:sulfate reduction electron transfer complex DsrMKJOP subunit DsrJ [Candidatus Magnetominusculus sp. LBB02]
MSDKGKAIFVLVIFLAVAAFPFLYNRAASSASPKIELNTPVIDAMRVKQCILPKEKMRHDHMQLLNRWRDEVVRDGQREFGEIDGVKYEKSLQKTCLHCHSNKAEFCDRCHTYASVSVYCWDCHLAPKENKP